MAGRGRCPSWLGPCPLPPCRSAYLSVVALGTEWFVCSSLVGGVDAPARVQQPRPRPCQERPRRAGLRPQQPTGADEFMRRHPRHPERQVRLRLEPRARQPGVLRDRLLLRRGTAHSRRLDLDARRAPAQLRHPPQRSMAGATHRTRGAVCTEDVSCDTHTRTHARTHTFDIELLIYDAPSPIHTRVHTAVSERCGIAAADR
jgi:hypothetical protein